MPKKEAKEEVVIEEKKVKKPIKKAGTFKTAEIAFITVITGILGIFLGVFLTIRLYLPNSYRYDNIDKDVVDKFVEIFNYIKDKSFTDVSDQDLIDAAISGMLESVGDNHTSLLTPEETTDFEDRMNGEYKGLGIEIANLTDGRIMVMNVFKNTPAEKAGVKAGDILLKLDGEDLAGKTTAYVVEKIKGIKGKEVTLVVLREEAEKTITLTTGDVEITYVYSELFEKEGKKIGYIAIDAFANVTYNQFKTALEELESKKIDSLIIDVRDNTGGYLHTTENIISLFLDDSKVIYQIQSKTETKKVYSKGKVTKTYPIVVLSNNMSASGSEILMMALKESYGATLIGKDSYRKGTAQEAEKKLSDGSLIKITTKRWLTPKGNWITDMDKIVDIEIALDANYLANPSYETDNQLQKAIETLLKK